jgi:hypothetical protein
MPFLPFLHQLVTVRGYPREHFLTKASWPLAMCGQGRQINDDVKASASQMNMRWPVITLANFQPVLVVPKSLLRSHSGTL